MATSFIRDFFAGGFFMKSAFRAVSIAAVVFAAGSAAFAQASGSAGHGASGNAASASGVGSDAAQVEQGAKASPIDVSAAVFQARMSGFDERNYRAAVASMFRAFEKYSGKPLKRGAKGRVGLKIYTNSGAGLATPKNLIDAVIAQLEKRGYKKSDITLVDMSRRKMRECGFLPKLSELQNGASDDYGGVNVADIDGGKFFDKNWYYDNALTPKNLKTSTSFREIYDPEIRKSYLPVPLFLTVDYWINLPVITDMQGLGVCAAIGNMSIWNMSNNERFLKEPANASMAAAEVCAIPELRETNVFTLLTFECGQFVGGSLYNARFSFSEKLLLLSANPVVLDYIAWQTLNKYRRANRFAPIEPEPPVLNYCRQLRVGGYDLRSVKRINVPYKVR